MKVTLLVLVLNAEQYSVAPLLLLFELEPIMPATQKCLNPIKNDDNLRALRISK